MSRVKVVPTGREQRLKDDEIIVSKTDPKGKITYINETFLEISGFDEEEVLGQPHSFIRHPEMPRAVFKLLWDTIQTGQEIFAYVINLCKNGDHYWVFAHVTPTFSLNGEIVGFHSNRRAPDPKPLATIQKLYQLLLQEEARHPDSRRGLEASFELLTQALSDKHLAYEEFIHSIA